MEKSEEELIRRSEPESLVSVTVGRFMSTLLTARPKKLRESISRLSLDSQNGSSGSVDEALWFLRKSVKDAAERDEAMDELLVPIIEHTLRFKDGKHSNPAMILLNWLFQDEVLFQGVSRNLSGIISRKEDRFLALGWCLLIRGLVESEDTGDQGIREKHSMFVEIVSSCVPHLLIIVRKGSVLQDGYEVPSRLSVSAADCLLSVTGALARSNDASANRPKPSATITGSHQPVALIPNISEKKIKQTSRPEDAASETNCILWNHLEELMRLVQCLFAWNRKTRLLHAKGLNKVLKWLEELKEHHGGSQKEAVTEVSAGGALLLSSCWKHYSILLHMEDRKFSKISKELLDQYMSGIKEANNDKMMQYYSESYPQGSSETKTGSIETQKFFLNCLCLLLGRFEGKKFETILSEFGMKLVPCLLHQLRSNNEEISEGVVAIFKEVISKLQSQSGDAMCLDVVIPSLLHLLDERDGAAKAVSVLLADYCSKNADNSCLSEVLQRLVSGTTAQRLNSMDVISEVIFMSKDLFPSHIPWKEIADGLLKCLGDEETYIRKQTSELLKSIEPSFVLPELITLVYSTNGNVQSSATETLLEILEHHKEDSNVVCMSLTCLSNTQALDTSESRGHPTEGSTFDSDRVLKLIPEWARCVQNWGSLIGPLLDKMFLEPSNAIMVRFLSCISEHLADASDMVLLHVLSHMKEQDKMDENSTTIPKSSVDKTYVEKSLFDHLCPLLILRLLPQRVFDDIDSSTIYGRFLREDSVNEYRDIKFEDCQCIAAFLFERAFSKFEFEEVRKLAAELCGRIHPQVLFPTVLLQLEKATELQDSLKIKACLFSICTSLVVRGWESFSHSVTPKVRKVLEKILLWPSDEDEISKVQHGCIDCLALMICAELQHPESSKTMKGEKLRASSSSVLDYTIHCLIEDRSDCSSMPEPNTEHLIREKPFPIPFRLCMANVLISACQKIPQSAKKTFARKALPPLVHSLKFRVKLLNLVQFISAPEVRAACIQVLFSAMYHLKSSLLPFASDLLKLALRFLEQGSEKEKLAGAKLMASLMASEDVVLERISGGLIEARSVLSKASLSDPSQDVREVCDKLLACITPS
ncbi:hypothetical protein IGI04_037780 [Brassica rapa subsp. trilocularis]|uniref:Uncharacterized protein n=1 Tax=Brassica rapa subsp. trilocularis TaxID=1813537 RepID=A0ABQ7LIC6_BRACM|nr:hypothetical protein IGI04_037780 [Brassica rapa subsp. trilocularis]